MIKRAELADGLILLALATNGCDLSELGPFTNDYHQAVDYEAEQQGIVPTVTDVVAIPDYLSWPDNQVEVRAWFDHHGKKPTVSWDKDSGPGNVTFQDQTFSGTENTFNTSLATFDRPGQYTLRFTVSTTWGSNQATLPITISDPYHLYTNEPSTASSSMSDGTFSPLSDWKEKIAGIIDVNPNQGSNGTPVSITIRFTKGGDLVDHIDVYQKVKRNNYVGERIVFADPVKQSDGTWRTEGLSLSGESGYVLFKAINANGIVMASGAANINE